MTIRLPWRRRRSNEANRNDARRMLRGLRRQQRSLHNGPAEADTGNSANDLRNAIDMNNFDGRGL